MANGPPLTVLDQSDRWVVVAKPPRWLVHRTPLQRIGSIVLQRLRNQLKRHVYPIHRLDYQASGCLVFALDPEAAASLQRSLSVAEKRYLALVRGAWTGPDTVQVDTPMKDENGVLKEASSIVIHRASSRQPRCSLLEVLPKTGRYHQVRRHVRDLGFPILGDANHGDTKENRLWRENFDLQRLALHAWQLRMPLEPMLYSEGREFIHATCPLFEDFARVLSQMPWWPLSLSPPIDAPFLPLPLE